MQPVSSTVSLIILAASTSHNSSSHKRGQLFIRTRNETLSVVAMSVSMWRPFELRRFMDCRPRSCLICSSCSCVTTKAWLACTVVPPSPQPKIRAALAARSRKCDVLLT
jgi:hypothetical protein